MITRAELKPLTLIPVILVMKRRLSVTKAMDSAKERAAFSMTSLFLKKITPR